MNHENYSRLREMALVIGLLLAWQALLALRDARKGGAEETEAEIEMVNLAAAPAAPGSG